jgi:hypothetical protein
MTNLKGPPAHETRQCLWHEPDVSFMVNPLEERVYTILVFTIGCVLFSCICSWHSRLNARARNNTTL